jgi:hypothetical protein
MRSRKTWVFTALALVAFGAASVSLLFISSGRITRASLEKIRIGMTKPEVEAVLGKPRQIVNVAPYSGPNVEYAYYVEDDRDGLMPANSALVVFRSGKVSDKDFHPGTARFWMGIRGRLGD